MTTTLNNNKLNTNYANRRPRWNQKWELDNNDTAVILIPKFGDHRLGRWLMQRMARPYYRLNLDKVGTFIWQRCDGSNRVGEIGRQLSEEFGDQVEPLYERLQLFFVSLERTSSIKWD